MNLPPIAYSYQAFAVFPARTVIGTNPIYFVAGIPKTFMAEFRVQHPEYAKAGEPAVTTRILKLKENEIIARLGDIAPGFELRPITIEIFTLPSSLPTPRFRISNGGIPIWDNEDLGAQLSRA